MQELQNRMSIVGGHGDLQSRVPGALLRGQSAPAIGEILQQHSRAGAESLEDAADCESDFACAVGLGPRQAMVRHSSPAQPAALRASYFSGMVQQSSPLAIELVSTPTGAVSS